MPATGSVSWIQPFTLSCPDGTITFTVDPDDEVVECTESSTAAACTQEGGVDTLDYDVICCPIVDAGPDDATCAGEPVDLSGAATTYADEFAWDDGGAGGSFDPGSDVRNPTYTPPNKSEAVDVNGYSTFRQVYFSATFEGETQTGLGVRARLPFRAFTLAGPGVGSRLVVDVAHRWYPRPTQPERTVSVYFNTGDGTDCEQVTEFERDATGVIATIRHSLDNLVAGPTAEEQAQGAFSPFSAATAGSISSVNLKSDGLLIVDFRNLSGFDLGGSSSCGYGALTSSLNTTVFQFPVVKRVRYQTNGSCDDFFELLPVECTVFER
mgnify:CR=1 FL=1